MQKVLVWVPSYDGWIHESVCNRAILLREDKRYEITLEMPVMRPVSNALNEAAKRTVEDKHDWLLVMDADNPPQQNPLDLILYNKPIITCATPIFNANALNREAFPIYWNGFMYDKEKDGYRPLAYPADPNDPIEVDAVGAGCLLVKREVFEKIEKPPFYRRQDEWGITFRGPDFIFCEKAKAAGFSCWIHYGYTCNHIKEVGMFEAMEAVAMERKATIDKMTNGRSDQTL